MTRAEAATIAGNTIRTLGAQAVQSALRAAILTVGVSIEVANAKASAVLGNVTTGRIVVPGGALQPPWDALNLHL